LEKSETFEKVRHIWKSAAYLENCGTFGKKTAHFEKCATFGKERHIWKRADNMEK